MATQTPKQRRTEMVSTVLRPIEKERLREHAEATGLTMSTAIQRMIVRELGPQKQEKR
jgi:hypothetical protein